MLFIILLTALVAASLPYFKRLHLQACAALISIAPLLYISIVGGLVLPTPTELATAYSDLLNCAPGTTVPVMLFVYALCTHWCRENFMLVSSVALGGLLLVQTSDLLLALTGLELASYSTYLLTASSRDEPSEAASLKYFLLGSLASAFIYLGLALQFTSTGLMDLQLQGAYSPIGALLLVTGLCWKIAAAPLQSWALDVYDAVPATTTAVISLLPKIALVLFLLGTGYSFGVDQRLLLLVTALSLCLGSIGGLFTDRIKRLLTYSSVLNIGFMLLLGYLGAQPETVMLYALQYFVGTAALWAVLTSLPRVNSLDQLQGLHVSAPALALVLLLLVLSLAGIPPLLGFWAKYAVLLQCIGAGQLGLALLVVVVSVVSTAYYLRFLRAAYSVTGTTVYIKTSLTLELASPLALAALLSTSQLHLITSL